MSHLLSIHVYSKAQCSLDHIYHSYVREMLNANVQAERSGVHMQKRVLFNLGFIKVLCQIAKLLLKTLWYYGLTWSKINFILASQT